MWYGPSRTSDVPPLQGILDPSGGGPRTFQCFDCNRPDPMKTEKATGWLMGELQPLKR